ncbi:hypothetical protein [Thalassoroseus pseudoceratinae]|uniref:hypothetical protein n=1 Tax=Thalassoroseus pseudoceratinae TaxID=2713176 RepID=UPI001422157F|nr:hypothetical protein [Thalassoroseus pseudoceratinae]
MSTGCGSSRDPNLPLTAPAGGQVTYNGSPVDQGTVTFHPVGKGNPGVGLIDEDGHFEISTYEPGDGAVVGKHAVTIDIPPTLGGMPAGKVQSVPKKYTSPDTTPLTVEITEDGDQSLELVVKDSAT